FNYSRLSEYRVVEVSSISSGYNSTDLKKEKVLGTGSEYVGLYMFDVDCDKFAVSNQILLNNERSSKEHTEVSTLNFLDLFESKPVTKTPLSPNDDEEGSHSRDGRVHQPVLGSTIDQPGHDEDNSATPVDEHNTSRSNVA
ncbi:hypothetical protein Tco_0817518, partial [Tanacetum coccineum]